MTAAARAAEAAVRLRQTLSERAAAASTARVEELQLRFEAERQLARSTYRNVEDPRWRDRAGGQEIADAYQAAATWRDVDQDAARAEQRIVDEVRARYDVDVPAIAAVPVHLVEAERGRAERDAAEAFALTAAADHADRQVEEANEQAAAWPAEAGEWRAEAAAKQGDRNALDEGAEVAWDSVERRELTAREMEGRIGDRDAVDTAMAADKANAKPPREATRGAGNGRANKARTTRGSARSQQRQRGLSR